MTTPEEVTPAPRFPNYQVVGKDRLGNDHILYSGESRDDAEATAEQFGPGLTVTEDGTPLDQEGV
jgi:hypothetical protein